MPVTEHIEQYFLEKKRGGGRFFELDTLVLVQQFICLLCLHSFLGHRIQYEDTMASILTFLKFMKWLVEIQFMEVQFVGLQKEVYYWGSMLAINNQSHDL